MQGMPLYSNMSDEENSGERFSDEMGARNAQQRTSSHRKSSESGEDSDVRKKSRKSKRKSKRPPVSEDMSEEEMMAASRRKRESKMAASGLVVPGAPAGSITSRELTEDPRDSRHSSGSRPKQSEGPEGESLAVPRGIDEAVNVGDEEDPFTRAPQDRATPRPSSNPKKNQEINKDFKDVRETGRWGNISKKEMWIVGILGLLVVTGVVVAVVVLTTGKNAPATAPTANNLATSPPAPTAAPTVRVVLTAQQQLDEIRAATIDNPSTESSLQLLPEDVSFYEGKANDATVAPVVRASSWIMYDDPIDNEDWLVIRYALAVLYYSTGGEGWTNNTGWMTDDSACEWRGIRCDRFNKTIEEIDISKNNLVGTIPNEVSMVKKLISLWLRKNTLSGTVPNVALGSIPQLSILYLDDNNLNGTITPDLAASGSLKTLFIQGNSLTGVLPYEFCPQRGVGGLLEFGIDCDNMECFCCSANNCF